MCDGGCDGGSCGGDCGMMGGAGSPVYNNGFNTMGVGDVVVPGANGVYGSGDLFASKKKKNKSGFGIATKKGPNPKNNNSGFVTSNGNTFDMSPRPLIVPVKPQK